MVTCPACSQEAPDGSSFCPACAAPLGPASTEAPTLASPDADDATPAAPASAPTSSAAADEPRFVPGTILASRYLGPRRVS